jgi:RNA polymerase sigma-70 factor (ECF subfamily)
MDLPDHYRSIIILRFFEDFKIEEIAEVLDENVNTVKTRLYKSLEVLRIKMIV